MHHPDLKDGDLTRSLGADTGSRAEGDRSMGLNCVQSLQAMYSHHDLTEEQTLSCEEGESTAKTKHNCLKAKY